MFNQLFELFATFPYFLQIIVFIVCLILGFIALVKGADWFVSSASGLAKKMGVSALLIGLTIVSIGTSAPETSVSISSAISGSCDLSIGNIVGSNIFNLLVVLGFSAVFMPVIVDKMVVKRDLPIMLGSGVLITIFALFFGGDQSYMILQIEGLILVAFLVGYLILTIKTSKRENKLKIPDEPKINTNVLKSIFFLIIGLGLIILGGEFVTYGAKNIALQLGASEALVGLTIVAIGTSLPELVTSIVAAKKGENEIALGNVIGSNIFNILFVIGSVSIIRPLLVSNLIITDLIIMIALFAGIFIYTLFRKTISKKVGIVMLLTYGVYLTYIILRNFL